MVIRNTKSITKCRSYTYFMGFTYDSHEAAGIEPVETLYIGKIPGAF